MSKIVKIEIPVPCHEDWNQMSPLEMGRHCAVCQKKVTDFSTFTNRQIQSFYENPENNKACGRFRQGQLEAFNANSEDRTEEVRSNFLRPIFATALLTAACNSGTIQKGNPEQSEQTVESHRTMGEVDTMNFALGKVAVEKEQGSESHGDQKTHSADEWMENIADSSIEINEIRIHHETANEVYRDIETHTAGVPLISYEESVQHIQGILVTSTSRKSLFKRIGNRIRGLFRK